MAFAWNGGDGEAFSIYVKLVGAGAELRLTTTAGQDSSPTWSPDSRFIAFHRQLPSGDGYYLVPVLGGQEQRLAASYATPVSLGRTLDWSPDGKFLVVADASESGGRLNLLMITADKGEVRALLRQPPPYLYSPAFSPDGKYLAYIAGTGFLAQDVYVVPVSGGEARQLTFERKHLAGLAWTADGRGIVFSSNRGGLFGLWRIPAAGGEPTAVGTAGEDAQSPVVSRRGDRLGYVRMQADWNIWRAPAVAESRVPPAKWITSTRDDWQPEYSPAGEKIAFVSTRSGSREIFTCDADGTHPVQLTSFQGPPTGTPRWSPDGQRIAFDSRAPGNSAIYVVSVEGGAPVRLTQDGAESVVPSWSADGGWIYFGSDRTGREEVWKMPSTGGSATQVTDRGGRNGMESPDGTYLYYWREGWVYRRPLARDNGAPESRLVEAAEWGHWVAGTRGIFLLNVGAKGGPAIDLFDPASGLRTRLVTLDRWPRISSPPSFTVSRNGLWALFARVDQIDNDIMVVENFR
jgi:Tol biopolymer transport system component